MAQRGPRAVEGEIYKGRPIRSWLEGKRTYVARAFVLGHLILAKAKSRQAAVAEVKRRIAAHPHGALGHGNAMTERRARIIRESETRFEQSRAAHDPKRYKRGGGYTPEEYKAIARRAGISRAPSNRAKSKLEIYNFLHNPPDKLVAFYNLKRGVVTTWPGDVLGHIVHRGQTVRGFGGGKSLHIRVRGINGVMYAGRCNLTGGDYCTLRRMASTRTR